MFRSVRLELIKWGMYFVASALVAPFASAQALQFSPSPIDFGSLSVGTVGNPWSVNVSNMSGNAVTLTSPSLSNAADFRFTSQCPTTLQPYSSCSMQIGFAPSQAARSPANC